MDYSAHDPDNPAASPWATPDDERPSPLPYTPSFTSAPLAAETSAAPFGTPISPGLFADDFEHNAFSSQISSGTGETSYVEGIKSPVDDDNNNTEGPVTSPKTPGPIVLPDPTAPEAIRNTALDIPIAVDPEQPPATPVKSAAQQQQQRAQVQYAPGFVPPLGQGPNQAQAVNVPVGEVPGGCRMTSQQQQQQQQQQQAGGPGKLMAKITGLERPGKKDPILRFDVHTNLPRFRTTQYRDVRRTHSEFVKFAEHLISANPDALVPAVPPSSTSAGAGTGEDEVRVKALLQRWFNTICVNEVLMNDDEMILFVESDFGYSPMVRRKQPATGVRRKILKQFAPPPDDTPELERARPVVKLFYLGSMDAGHKIDKLVKGRRGLAQAESDFGVKIGALAVQEPHAGLANAYRKLGKMIQTVGDCHAAQATAEATTLGDPFQYHSDDAFIVKETLTNRQILIRDFLQAQETTRTKLTQADRLKSGSSVRREKVDEAIAQLEEARAIELSFYNKTQRVTTRLIGEKNRWMAHTATDLRASIREFTLREIEAERRMLAMLESVRPDIRGIDNSGGLSRLGRESHPVVRRSVGSSQGPKGDAWSGIARRSGEVGIGVGVGVGIGVPEEEERAVMAGVVEDDDNRLDARNAASRLAASTF